MANSLLFLPLSSSIFASTTARSAVRLISTIENNRFAFRLNAARNQVPLVLGHDSPKSGLGGISFDEGRFSVFWYTTGKEVLSQIKTGDIIRSARLVEGQDRLVVSDRS